MRHLPGWRATWQRFVRCRAEADALIYALIARRRAEIYRGAAASAKRGAPPADASGGCPAADVDGGALLDTLIATPGADGAPMDAGELRDQLVSLVIAGHETTASALAWALQLLAHNPAVQERLAEEIAAGGGEQYMLATVQEVLRHSPVFIFAAPRAVARPIEIGGWVYRPPAHLLGCTYLLHHDPALYPEPERFRPERFLGAGPRARLWLPWGGGRRVCLGRHLAVLEITLVLRALLAERRVEPAAGSIERPGWRTVMVAPGAGCRVILRRRTPRHWETRADSDTVGTASRVASG